MSFYYIKNNEELVDLKQLSNAAVIGIDTETTGKNALQPHQDRVRLIQLATKDHCFIVDLDKVNPFPIIEPILSSKTQVKVFHNAKFDIKHLYHHYAVVVRNVFCTQIAATLLAKGRPARLSLAQVVQQYLGVHLDKGQQRSDWSGNLTEEQLEYAATDAEILIPLYERLADQLRSEKLNKVSQLEFRTILPVACMELKGVFIDQEKLDALTQSISQELEEIKERVLDQLQGRGSLPGMNMLNINSPDEVKEALEDRGIRVEDTSEASLRPLAKEYVFIKDLLEYRHKQRILNTTLQPFKAMILPETKRVHSHYTQIASASGRFACTDPNIQQVPREKEVRACFCPEPGKGYIIADYSQVELRVAAGLANDETMLQAYAKGEDLHRLTAAITKGKSLEDVTPDERQAAKAINFGLIYAMGAKGLKNYAELSYGVNMSEKEAVLFRDRYFQSYKGVHLWQARTEAQVRQRMYVRTAAGRIRSYAGEKIRVNELLNIPVQGTAAEGLKSAMCIFWDKIHEAKLDAGIIAIIHDEIIVEAREDQLAQAKAILEASMIQGISWLVPNVPFEAEAHIGTSWADK